MIFIRDILLAVEIKKYNLSTHVPENDLINILGIMINNMLEATPANSSCTLTIDSVDNKIISQDSLASLDINPN